MNILKNILRFTNLAVGIPTVLPHLLNVNQVPVLPQIVIPREGGISTAADTLNVTVTRLSGGPQDVDVYVEHWHTIESALPLPGQLAGLVPFLLEPGTSGPGGSSNLGSTCLVYMPGSGMAGPVTFDSWPDLMAQLNALKAVSGPGGCFTVAVDNSLVFPLPAVVPPGGPYDFANVFLIGNYQVPQISAFVNRLDVSDGATFANLRNIQALHLVNLNNTTPMDSTLGTAPTNGEIIRVSIGAILENNGLAPMWRIVPGAIGAMGVLLADIIGTIGAVVDLPAAGTIFATGIGAGSKIGGGAWSGVAGSFIQLGRQASGATLASVYPNFLGTLAVSASGWTDSSVLRPFPFGGAPITSGTVLEYGALARCDASGGAFAVTLPPLSTANTSENFNPGSLISIVEVSGSVGLTVAPNVGDTINGAAAAVPVLAGGAVTLVNDGFSDWRILSSI